MSSCAGGSSGYVTISTAISLCCDAGLLTFISCSYSFSSGGAAAMVGDKSLVSNGGDILYL